MKILGSVLGLVAALFVHAVIFTFGGILTLDDDDERSVQPVELLSDLEVEQPKKPEEPPPEQHEELAPEDEKPPDSADLLRDLETPPTDDGPALEAASLDAIEAALGGQSGGGDFAAALSFGSGGRIGATGLAVGAKDAMDAAFSLAELDQSPRAVFQGSPTYPGEMRGKKIEGVVTLVFVVDPDGKVANPRVEKSTHAAFEAPALKALEKWKFEPGVRAGQRVATKMRVSIRFPPN